MDDIEVNETGRLLLAPAPGANGNRRQPFSLHGGVELGTGTDVGLQCSTRDADAVVRVHDVSITAIAVDDLSAQFATRVSA